MRYCHPSICLLFLSMVNVQAKTIELSPYAFWDPKGVTVTGWSNGTNGSSPSQLSRPFDLSIGINNILYVSDIDNNRVIAVALNDPNNKSIIGPIPNSNTSQFNAPHGLYTTDTSLYINDHSNHRVQKLAFNDTNLTVALNLNASYRPFYLFVDENIGIYFSEINEHRVSFFHFNSTNGTIVAGNGMDGSNDTQLNRPYGIFVDHRDNIYIADSANHRIMKWARNANFGVRVAGDGTLGSSSTQLNHPSDVLVDIQGIMYITEDFNHRIVRWAPSANYGICIVACEGHEGSGLTRLSRPHSLTFDSNGSLYAADYGNNRVQNFQIFNRHTISYEQPAVSRCATWHPHGTTFFNISTIDLNFVGVFVQMNDTADEILTNQSKLLVSNSSNSISDWIRSYNLFITIQGNVYADNGAFVHRLHKWSKQTESDRSLMPDLHGCISIFIDINDSIYCSMNQKHQVVKTLYDHMSADRTITFGNETNGSAPDLLNFPSGIFVDIELRLYVADTANHRIQRFENGSRNGITVAGNGNQGDKGLNFPTAIVVDINDHLFIVDRGNHRIIRSEPNGFRCIIGGRKLHHPRALWFDHNGNMFVLDQDNHRIQKFLLQTDDSASSSCSIPLTCWNRRRSSFNCTYSTEICDELQPCLNDGTCTSSDDNENYNCTCTPDFQGRHCQLDRRICRPDTCSYNGICNETSECNCTLGWEGRRCEHRINYCKEIRCENRGVCQSFLSGPVCECPSDYSGEFCQITARRIVILKAVSKSFAYVAIIAMICVAAFVIIMDILKYGFGIDPVEEERQRMRREKLAKKRRPVIERFTYVNALNDPSTPKRRLSTIAEVDV